MPFADWILGRIFLSAAAVLRCLKSNSTVGKFTQQPPQLMPALELEKIGTNEKDRLNLYVPVGMKLQLEELRRVKGERSVTQVVVTTLQKAFLEEGI